MGRAADNQWRIHGSEQRSEVHRGQVMKQITLALVTTQGPGSESGKRGGFDPYDSRLGTTKRDVWGRRRRT